MQDSWLTVRSFSDPIQAHLIKTRLCDQGIRCRLADEKLVSANWLYATAIGGIRLQVFYADVEQAQQILNSFKFDEQIDWSQVDPAWGQENRQEAPAHAGGCPKCNCIELSYEPFDKRLVFLSILLLGVPLPFMSRKWRCDRCAHEWKNSLFAQRWRK